MGFMDKLRSMAAVVTGGNATVQVEVLDPCQDRPFTVNVQAEVGGSDLKIDKVYLKLIGVETVKIDVEAPTEAEPDETSPQSAEAQPESRAAKPGKDLSKKKHAISEPQNVESEQKTTATKEISRTEYTHQQEFEVSGPQNLSAEQTYTWTGEVQLPADAKPSYQGIHATHEWRLLAGLSTFGNDPDSGWETLEV